MLQIGAIGGFTLLRHFCERKPRHIYISSDGGWTNMVSFVSATDALWVLSRPSDDVRRATSSSATNVEISELSRL
eukprot:scaffold7349_cov173-Amphora_coffeaeformis.AAC.140